MQRLLIFSFLCICLLIDSANARSRNPRQADFEEVGFLAMEAYLTYISTKGSAWRKSFEEEYQCSPTQRVKLEGEILSVYMCAPAMGVGGSTDRAYINELDFSKTYRYENSVVIPCMAKRNCTFGYRRNGLFLFGIDSPDTANKIIELLKPN